MERIVEITYSSSESEQTVQVREENVSSILHGLNHMGCRLVGIKNVEENVKDGKTIVINKEKIDLVENTIERNVLVLGRETAESFYHEKFVRVDVVYNLVKELFEVNKKVCGDK